MIELRIDYGVLDAMHKSLDAVARKFEGLGEQAASEARIWGGGQVRAAMEEFADNWKSHRARLTEDAHKLSERCAATAEVFSGVDTALARSVRSSSQP